MKKAKKEKKPRDLASCVFTQTTHRELLPPKLVVVWLVGPRGSYILSFIEIGLEVWAQCLFSMLSSIAYIACYNRCGLMEFLHDISVLC